MIISHKYKYIFIKTSKTASTSIELALSRYCGDEDIITPVSPEDELERNRLGYRGPQNYLPADVDCSHIDREAAKKHGFYNHISGKEIQHFVGEETWSSYYKFCFERNPWDRFISLYYWRCKAEPRPTIAEFLESKYPLMLRKHGFNLYTANGEIIVNRVCRYENLSEELEQVRVQLGLPEKLDLPWAKSSFRNDRRSYRDILSPKQQEEIGKLFNQEISMFGYEL